MMLFVQLITGGSVYAADPPQAEYDAALRAFPSSVYYITTEVDGIKYYVTASGSLEERYEGIEASEGLFTINQVSGGALYSIGWHIEGANGHFSNTTLSDNKAVLNPGNGVFRLDGSNNRNDWESQVFFMNEEGKIAIRSCNTAFGESGYADAGRAFWTYEVDAAGDIVWAEWGPMPAYSYEPAYIWTLEQPVGFEQVKLIINDLYAEYEDLIWEEPDNPTNWGLFLNMGTDFGQYSDWDSYLKLWNLLQEVNDICDKFTDPDYEDEYYTDPKACTVEQAKAYRTEADSLYQVILDSEVPYSLPNGDGYYRIKSSLRYYTDTVVGTELDENDNEVDIVERTYVDKALLASFQNQGMYGTLREDMANQVWYLKQVGDSILMYNAGMQSYVSASKTPGSVNRMFFTEDKNDVAYVVFDWAGVDEVGYDTDADGEFDDWDEKETFNIRLNSKARHSGDYVHQLGHSTGKDSHKDMEVSFWAGTYGKDKYTNDGGASEWYLEPVTDEEVEAMLENFEILKNHDLLVTKNNELRQKVAETLEFAKDIKRTALITSASQLSSPNSDEAEGTNIGNLIDGDASSFWHTSWHGSNQYPRIAYDGVECHYLQISGMENMEGECEMYFRERAGADNDRPTKVVLLGANEVPEIPEGVENYVDDASGWEEIAAFTLPHTAAGEENTLSFTASKSFSYVRVLVTAVNSSFRNFWHAAEIQFYTVRENPNSQYVLLGEIATNLENIYNENLKVADDDITPEIYQKLLDAYEKFQGALVDPTEMRAALSQYAKASDYVVKGDKPGQFTDDKVAKDYNELYAKVDAYNTAGKYKADEIHKYAIMLKAMSKSLKEGANGVKTDKWYRIMFPTEEMYDAYDFSKEGGDNCSDLTPEDQKTMFGTFVSAAKLESESEEVTEDDGEGNEVTKTVTTTWLEAIGGEDLRESDRLFFMNDDDIEDKDASMFRFVELEAENAEPDYISHFKDVKENMGLAIDLNVTKRGEALITDAAQFSSNASYPGNDGGKLESGVLIDGSTSTYWHSDYSKTYCAVPYLQVALNEPVSGFIQVYVARRNTNNGHVVRMYVQGSNDAETWTNIGYIETPYVNATTPVYSQPIDLGASFKHLRFTMTNRAGSDGGSNIEFDPFAENLTADDYNTKFTYFHASEFQIYPVTVKMQSAKAQALLNTYKTENKVLLKDVTEEDFGAVDKVYKEYKTEYNASQFKTVLPEGMYESSATYALQNKATGLFVCVDDMSGNGGNTNNIYLKTIPTLVGYKAIGYGRSMMSARTVNGVSSNNLHAGESNRRFCTWGSTEPTSNTGLIICEADVTYAAPAEFSFYKDVKYGRIADWCHSVTLTKLPDATEKGSAYTAVGWYTLGEDEDVEIFLALKAIETIPAGEPALYIYGDTVDYDAEVDDDYEPVKFKISGNEKPVFEGKTVNGLMGTLVTYKLNAKEVYFNGNYAAWPETKGSIAVTPCSAVLDLEKCPQVDPEGEYDFSICLAAGKDAADGVKDVSTALENISKPGNVYSMDGKLLRTGATLNSLKSLGKGMYILNGVKVVVK